MFVQHSFESRDVDGILRQVSRAINAAELKTKLTLDKDGTVVTYPTASGKTVRLTLSRPLRAGAPAITTADVVKIEIDTVAAGKPTSPTPSNPAVSKVRPSLR